jgi:hypothetical protein
MSISISDVICFTETWLWEDEDKSVFELTGFKAHHNCSGRGRGVSVYYKTPTFTHIQDITEEKIQLTKLHGKNLDVIIVYKAPTGKDSELRSHLHSMIDVNKASTGMWGLQHVLH